MPGISPPTQVPMPEHWNWIPSVAGEANQGAGAPSRGSRALHGQLRPVIAGRPGGKDPGQAGGPGGRGDAGATGADPAPPPSQGWGLQRLGVALRAGGQRIGTCQLQGVPPRDRPVLGGGRSGGGAFGAAARRVARGDPARLTFPGRAGARGGSPSWGKASGAGPETAAGEKQLGKGGAYSLTPQRLRSPTDMTVSSRWRSGARVLAGLVLVAGWPGQATAQGVSLGTDGTLARFDTAVDPAPVAQAQVPVPAGLPGRPGEFRFEVGFSTQELPLPNRLVDSLTLTLWSGGLGGQPAVLVTVDAFGLSVAPDTPGGVPVGVGLTLEPVAPRVGYGPGLGVGVAYAGSWTLPESFRGADLTLSASFFHNGDALRSAGYAFIVPEPSTFGLLALGAGAGILWGRRRR